jgi:hypothetical protein
MGLSWASMTRKASKSKFKLRSNNVGASEVIKFDQSLRRDEQIEMWPERSTVLGEFALVHRQASGMSSKYVDY